MLRFSVPGSRRILTVVLVLIVAAAASPASAAPTWVRVGSPHFTVVSDDGEKAARGVAWQFEQVRAVLQRLWPWARFETGRSFIVFAVKNESGIRGIVPEYWEQKGGVRPSSAFFGGPNSHYVVLRTDFDASRLDVNPYRQAYWSYIGIVIDASFTRRPPPWFTRGLAEVMANTIVRADDLTIGQIVPWTLQRLQSGRLSLGEVMGAGYDSKYMRDEAWMQLFDASAWALVHCLMFGEQGANLTRFNQAATAILRGGDPDRAVGDAFGGLQAVSLAYNKYSSSPAFAYRRVDVDIDVKRDGFSARVLTPADAAATRGAALAAQGRTADATALLNEARATAPTLGAAFELEGLLADRAGNFTAARAAYAKADEVGGASYFASFRLAELRWPENGADRKAAFATMVAPLERALAANASFTRARSLLSQALVDTDRAADAWPHAQRVIAETPGESSAHFRAAQVLHALGKRPEAMAAVDRALALARTDMDRENARRFKEYLTAATGGAAPGEVKEGDVVARDPAGQAARVQADADRINALAKQCQAGDADACATVKPYVEQACDGGDWQACYFLGFLHERGRGMARDAARAAALYEKACGGGNDMACLAGGMLQWLGTGVPKDLDAATARFGALCGKGVEQACPQYAAAVLTRPTPEAKARARDVLDARCKAGMAKACELLAGMAK
jgi:tetratricopeptide (TPR) repeat protein